MPNEAVSQPLSEASILRGLSSPRLEGYRLTPTETVSVLVGRYRYNILLGQAFYPPLHYLEIALRNHLDGALAGRFGGPLWHDRPGVLEGREVQMIQRATSKLAERGVSMPRPEQLVAELEFGFWTSLLGTAYERPTRFWPALLGSAFPNIPRRLRTRKVLASRFHEVRQLRNRIFHHEPIWNQGDPRAKFRRLCETIDWFDPSLLALLPSMDAVDELHRLGPTRFEVIITP